MDLLAELLALDPEHDLGDDDPPPDYWALSAALAQAHRLLGTPEAATLHTLLAALRDDVAVSPFQGYLALLIQGRLTPLATGRAYHTLGRAIFGSGRAENDARIYFDLATHCYAACAEPPAHEQALLQAGYAGVLYASEPADVQERRAVARSLDLVREAIVFFERSGDRYNQARAWSILSDIYQYAEHEEALAAARHALELAEQEPQLHSRRGRLLRDLAQAHYFLHDDSAQASALLAQAEQLLDGDDANQRAALYATQALIALDCGAFHKAQRLLLAAQELYQRVDNQQDLALNALDQARVALALGDQQRAERLLWSALKGLKDAKVPKEQAEALALLASLHPLDEALGYFAEAERVLLSRNNPHALALLQFERARTVVRQRRGRRHAAERAAARAELEALAERFTALGRARYALLARVEAALATPGAAFAALSDLAAAVAAQGDPLTLARLEQASGEAAEASDMLDDAARAYGRAIAALAAARAQIQLNAQLARFLDQRRRPYERAFALAIGRSDLDTAWKMAERPRAIALLDTLANPHERGPAPLAGHPRWAEVQALREQLNAAYAARTPEARSNAMRSRSDHAGRADRTIAELEARLGELLDQIGVAGDRRASWELGAVCDPQALARQLGPHTALIEYMLVGRPGMPGTRDLMALLLTPAGLQAPGANGLIADEGVLTLFGARFESTALDDDRADMLPLLRDLYDTLVAPLAELIVPFEQLVVVLPDDEPWLARLPIHAAYDGARYLVQRHVVSYAPSASVLGQCLQRPAPPIRSSLACGYGRDLAHIRAELACVACALPHARAVLGPFQADALLSDMLAADLAHLSCHAAPGTDQEARLAYLAVAPDQFIFAHDCFTRQTAADLVVLSACETGREDRVGLGLVGGFLAAGARSVLATLWRAHDAACLVLMQQFYAEIAAPARPGRAAALAAAQRYLINSPDQSHPARWAPFMLVGAFDELNLLLDT